jgi:hypothetical protein
MKVGLDFPNRVVGEGDEGLDLPWIGVDTLVLRLEFPGPHTQADILAVDPHDDPVGSDADDGWR